MGNWGPDAQAWHYPTSPTGHSEDGDSPEAAAAAVRVTTGVTTRDSDAAKVPAAVPAPAPAAAEAGVVAEQDGLEGEFRCAAVYPCAETSLELGRKNLHLFR